MYCMAFVRLSVSPSVCHLRVSNSITERRKKLKFGIQLSLAIVTRSEVSGQRSKFKVTRLYIVMARNAP